MARLCCSRAACAPSPPGPLSSAKCWKCTPAIALCPPCFCGERPPSDAVCWPKPLHSPHPERALRLEDVLQPKLDQARSNGRLRDPPEAGRSKRRARIAELRVIECVVELHAEGHVRYAVRRTYVRLLAEREVRVELPGPIQNALPGVAIARRSICADCGRGTELRRVEVVV